MLLLPAGRRAALRRATPVLRGSATVPGVRGTHARLPAAAAHEERVLEALREAARLAGCRRVRLPTLESVSLFARTLGEASDVVSKEMFVVKGGKVALRPEGTAGAMRAALAAGLQQASVFYEGPMFRYERPQRGRSREFLQLGVELLGDPSPAADATAVAAAHRALRALGVAARVELRLNSLGDAESRAAYRGELRAYLEARAAQLSERSRERLARGAVLRVLDSKEAADAPVVAAAPLLSDALGAKARARAAEVEGMLADAGVPFVRDPRLVRGLDYYESTAFEFVAREAEGRAANAVLAGGRYDGLAQMLGAKRALPGVGWAAGVERIGLLLDPEVDEDGDGGGGVEVAVAPISAAPGAARAAVALAEQLRERGVVVALQPRAKPAKAVGAAAAAGARALALIGDDELAAGEVAVRDLGTREQVRVGAGEAAVAAVLGVL